MKRRHTFTLSEDLLSEIAEFRWRNRIPSLSRALELILRHAAILSGEVVEPWEAEAVQQEREQNNKAYQQVKATLEREKRGGFVIIALGSLQGYAGTLEEAYSILGEKAPTARHAIIDRVGEKFEAEAVWEAIGERIS